MATIRVSKRNGWVRVVAALSGALTIVLGLPVLHAVDTSWGLALDGNAVTALEDAPPEAGGAVTGWLRSRVVLSGDPVAPRRFLDLALQGRFQYTSDLQFLDLETLRLRGQWDAIAGTDGVLRTQTGRFRVVDRSSAVLDHPLDGAGVDLSWRSLRVSATAGYSGWLLNAVSRVRMTDQDVLDQQNEDLHFAPGRIIGIARISLPEFMRRQTFDLELTGQRDLRDAAAADRLDTGYLTIALTGPVVPRVYYDVVVTAMAAADEMTPAAHARGSFWITGGAAVPMRVSASVGWASGRSAVTAPFVPITRDAVGSILLLPVQNVVQGQLALSVRPASFLQVSTDATVFLIGSSRLPDLAGVNPAAESGLIGAELTGRMAIRPTSDLGVGVTAASFFPATGSWGIFNEGVTNQARLGVEVSLGL